MEIVTGRKNLAFGWMWLALGMLFGFFLDLKMRDPNWAGNQFEGTNWLNHAATAAYSFPRVAWRTAHAHWGILALVNILYGILVDQLAFSSFTKNLGSLLCIFGTVLFSGGLFAAGFNPSLAVIALGGFICVGLACMIQVAGWMAAVK